MGFQHSFLGAGSPDPPKSRKKAIAEAPLFLSMLLTSDPLEMIPTNLPTSNNTIKLIVRSRESAKMVKNAVLGRFNLVDLI